jgi:signal transduction histidine kinase
MEDKRPIVYPSLLFAILFILISITGYFQVRVTQKNMESLLLNEGETLFKHVKREIDINLEYLDLLDKSPSLITPNQLGLMVYDEAIVEDLYSLLHNRGHFNPEDIPFSNVVVTDGKGKTVFTRGSVTVPPDYARRLAADRQGTVVRMPTSKDRSLLMGVKQKDVTLFLSLNDRELTALRKKLIVRSILEREEKSFNIVGTTLYDPNSVPYASLSERKNHVFTIHRPLGSKFLPGYTLEILISRYPADSALKRTAISFIVMLLLLAVAGALSTYAIFLLERRHGKKMKEIEKDMDLKERLVSLGRLASGMAHEIRNPLNAISMSAQRLKREFTPEKDKEEYYRFIDIMRSELLRVNRIVEEFLLSTRSHVPFLSENLYTIVEDIVQVITEKARSQDIRLINKTDQDVALECQKERLKQALYNLIMNGMEAIKAKGTIELSTEVKGGNVELSVKDSGPGIKAENLHTIFEYYYTTKDKGMGLGLPISYMIIKDHGGDMKAMSEEGNGATFVVTLPLVHAAVNEPTAGKGLKQ